MAIQKAQMEKLQQARDQLAAEIEAKRHQLAGLDQALALLLSGEDDNAHRRSRGATKQITLDLLKEFNETGLSASEVVEVAQQRGQALDRASVSSLLSRLKRENVLVSDGSKYRVPTPRAEAAIAPEQSKAADQPSSGREVGTPSPSGVIRVRMPDGSIAHRYPDGTIRRIVRQVPPVAISQ